MKAVFHQSGNYICEIYDANPKLGYNFPFILIRPLDFNPNKKLKIYVEGNNSVVYEREGQQSFSSQVQYAINQIQSMNFDTDGKDFTQPYFYQCLNSPIIMPLIERCDYDHEGEFYPQMLGRNVVKSKDGKFTNLTHQVVCMVDKVKNDFEKQGIKVERKSGLIGFSASGVFAGRMLLAEPESFDFCLSMCSNAVQPLPLEKINDIELPYPLGIADYEEIFGKKFNKEEYLKAHSLFAVGKDEPNERYDIALNPRLHDKEIQELYVKIYGNVGIQARQEKMETIVREKGFDNMNCVVASGGHNYGGKGNLIVNFTFNDYTISNKPKKS